MTKELDRWAAELMGWWLDTSGRYWCAHGQGPPPPKVENWHPSNPSTGQIWLVIEKMQELGWKWSIDYDSVTFWQNKFRTETIGNIQVSVPDTSPEAVSIYDNLSEICLAILKAAKAALEGE